MRLENELSPTKWAVVIFLFSQALCSCNAIGQEKTRAPESLSQFVFDVTVQENVKAGLAVLEKYKDSEKFYRKREEFVRTSHILYQRGNPDAAKKIFLAANELYPMLKTSFALQLFETLNTKGLEAGRQWLAKTRESQETYLDESEFDLATHTLFMTGKTPEAVFLAKAFIEKFPDSKDAYHRLADAFFAEGKKDLALQTYREHLARNGKRNDFFKLATQPPTTYVPTALPADATHLFNTEGNPNSEIVFVFVQGGPDPDFGVYRNDPLELLPNQDNILRVHVTQSQILNEGLLATKPVLTNKQALFEHRQSAEILHRTVKHFKDAGKKVFVIGHSYGCLIGIEYLHSKPNLADKLILMGSDFDEDLRNYPSEIRGTGKLIRWTDGVEPFQRDFFGDFTLRPLMNENLKRIFENTDLLVSAHAKRRFTKLLNGKDLSNVIFAHGKFDESNGRTKPYELEFLQNHGATTIETYGDHHSMLSPAVMTNLYHHVINEQPLKRSIASMLADTIDSKGIETAIDEFKLAQQSEAFHPIVESEINFLGYQLIKQKKPREASEIFKLNVKAFPESWNAYDSLAESYLNFGNKEEAIKYCKKSLELHPGNTFGIAAIKEIEQDRISEEPGSNKPNPNNSLESMLESVERKIQTCMSEQRLPGVAIVVTKNGKTIFKRGYGLANVEKRTPVDPDKTVFRIGSISKALTLLTLTRLVDAGKLNLDDDVSRYFPGIKNDKGFKRSVTIQNLMTHTTGFDQIGIERQVGNFNLDLEQRKSSRPTITQFLNSNNLRRVSPPGEYFRYDTYGTTLAGAIIEKVTGLPFAAAMRTEMFNPLGMARSSVEVEARHQQDLALGYGFVNGKYVPQPYEVYVTTPASSIDATTADMGRLLEALTGDGANSIGRFVSEKTTNAILAPQFRPHQDFAGLTHGLRESFVRTNDKRVMTVGHGGSMLGFNATLAIFPQEKLGIYIVTNRNREGGGGNVSIGPRVLETIVGNLNVPKQKLLKIPSRNQSINLSEYEANYYYGTFCHSCTDAEFAQGGWRRGAARKVFAQNGGLLIGDDEFLPAEKEKDLFVQADGQRSVVFGRDEQGRISFFVYSTSADTFERE